MVFPARICSGSGVVEPFELVRQDDILKKRERN